MVACARSARIRAFLITGGMPKRVTLCMCVCVCITRYVIIILSRAICTYGRARNAARLFYFPSANYLIVFIFLIAENTDGRAMTILREKLKPACMKGGRRERGGHQFGRYRWIFTFRPRHNLPAGRFARSIRYNAHMQGGEGRGGITGRITNRLYPSTVTYCSCLSSNVIQFASRVS